VKLATIRILSIKRLSHRMRRRKLQPAAASTALMASPLERAGEVTAAHAVIVFKMSDDGLDAGATFELSNLQT
jgi:hypothetical protein